jgi:putative DNA primase/helicase
MKVENAELLLTAILEAAGDDELEARLAGLRATAERLAAHQNVQAWGTAAEYFGQAVVKRARSWLKEAFAGEPAGAVWAAGTLTDTDNAELFAVQHAERARHVPGLGWLVYDESLGRFERDGAAAVQLAIETARSRFAEAARCADERFAKRLASWATRSLSRSSIEATLTLAESMPALRARVESFDQDPMLLNVRNGVVDLTSGELLPHSATYMMSKVAGTDYEPGAPCVRWRAHLERIFAADQATIDFLQRLSGFALTGVPIEQKVVLLYGSGANGKTVTVEAPRKALGEYAETADFKTFSVTRNDGPRNDLAKLVGTRFVTASETNPRQKIDEALIKQVTGGEPITTRFMYKEFFTYLPQFTVFLSTNHLPNIEGIDRGLWRRLFLIPFTVTIPEPDQDRDLPDKLRAELPGILAWMVQGCLAWQRQGFDAPMSVQMATAEYHDETDLVGQFVAECLKPVTQGWVELQSVYAVYKSWCERNGYTPGGAQQLSQRLRDHGLTLTKDAPQTHRSRLRGHLFRESVANQTEPEPF